jgi:hypothetical protein
MLAFALAVVAVAARAPASLTVNLRFPDGSTTKNMFGMQPGDVIEFEVWATIVSPGTNSAPGDCLIARIV